MANCLVYLKPWQSKCMIKQSQSLRKLMAKPFKAPGTALLELTKTIDQAQPDQVIQVSSYVSLVPKVAG